MVEKTEKTGKNKTDIQRNNEWEFVLLWKILFRYFLFFLYIFSSQLCTNSNRK